jgi:hypothetical protein
MCPRPQFGQRPRKPRVTACDEVTSAPRSSRGGARKSDASEDNVSADMAATPLSFERDRRFEHTGVTASKR